MKNVMIDLETLSTRADGIIMSIGAVKFDTDLGVIEADPFYVSISIDSNREARRHLDESTLIWWLQQSKEAQTVFSEPKVTLRSALEDLADFIGGEDVRVWSNGADFDIPMLAHAYHTFDLAAPWAYSNTRCYRTYKNIEGLAVPRKPRQGTHHNALEDALYQADHLIALFRAMRGGAGQQEAA